MIEDLARTVFRETGEKITPTRWNTVDTRLLSCLRRHRLDGNLATIYVPGRKAFGWVLATRLAEFFRLPNRPINIGKFDFEIRDITASSEVLLSCPEIARHLHERVKPKVSRRGCYVLRGIGFLFFCGSRGGSETCGQSWQRKKGAMLGIGR
jgi:hypothetical protein